MRSDTGTEPNSTREWTGRAPFQVQWRAQSTEGPWTDIGPATDMSMATVAATGDTAFFRIVSMVGQPSPTARYRVQFEATWSSQTHPINFPAAPHFSGLIGAIHDGSVVYWTPGMTASPGIELMAETGGKALLEGDDRLIHHGRKLRQSAFGKRNRGFPGKRHTGV